jgi:sugar transferase (PEP-CTERM system associated)
MRLFKRYVSARSLTVFVAEVLLIFGSILAAARLHGSVDDLGGGLWKAALVAGLCQMALYYNDFYDLTLVQTDRETVVRLLQAAGAASIVLAVIYFAVPSVQLGDGVFVTSLGLFLSGVLSWRLAFNRVAGTRRLGERVLIVGTGMGARTVAGQILAQREFSYHVVGFVDDDPDAVGSLVGTRRIVGTPASLSRLIDEQRIDRIIVSLADRRGRLPVDQLLQAKLSGVQVEDAMTAYERLTGKILLDDLKPSWLIFSSDFRVSHLTRLAKRLLDLAAAIPGIVLALPLMMLTAMAVRLDSVGPVLYRQERVGEGGRVFTLYKFRSMRADAENGVPVWAADGDQRVTRIGRIIRKTRLDEMPQLWNVIRGDMSFVGPRPERPFFVESLSVQIPFYRQRHAVKPGITGWAQVKYHYGSSIEDATEKLRYDLYYIKHLSIIFDVTILLDTVKVILFGKGAK